MARSSVLYVCQSCGAKHTKWAGRCDNCHAWNTLQQETTSTHSKSVDRRKTHILPVEKLTEAPKALARLTSPFSEFDRVLGGGLVPGSVLLLGGDPGIGKSTLLLQISALLAQNTPLLYVSGEEATTQIQERAHRLGFQDTPLDFLAATHLGNIIETIEAMSPHPSCVIIDSIQTMFVDTVDASPGTVTQVRLAAHALIEMAKRHNITVVLVGHVTKEGAIAGPRVLEHMVDSVLYFEGERGHQFRILRAVKNRFGPTNEIGVFEMTAKGLQEVKNPSELFLSDMKEGVTGSVVYGGIEGTRPIFLEIQALVSPTNYGNPRRNVVGWDQNRLSMILAVLESRGTYPLGDKDVFLNVAGGYKVNDPAADLAVAFALVSALLDKPISPHSFIFGEIGLSGEIRRVPHTDARLREGEKLGFTHAIFPKPAKNAAAPKSLTLTHLGLISDMHRYIQEEL